MFKDLWSRIRSGRKIRKDHEPSLAEMGELMTSEFHAVKKLLRKQSLLVEEIQASLKEAIHKEPQDPLDEGLVRLAAAFFHLERSVGEPEGLSSQRRQSFELFWLYLEELLATHGIQVIRKTGVAFDPRLHQAVLSRAPDARNPRIVEVLQPGFLQNGRVIQPAKVILGPSDENERKREDEQKEWEVSIV